MLSTLSPETSPLSLIRSSSLHRQLPCPLSSNLSLITKSSPNCHHSFSFSSKSFTLGANSTFSPNHVSMKSFRLSPTGDLYVVSDLSVIIQPTNGVYTVGEFMTPKEELHVVKPTTTVDEALEALVENRITGFPVIDENWKLVGVVSDFDLLALDSISGAARTDTDIFPEVNSNWKTFNEVQRLLSKTNGKLVGDLMTPAPVVVRESSNLEDAARLLLKTKYRRLPVVDSEGKLVGIITRGNVVRAALQIKRASDSPK